VSKFPNSKAFTLIELLIAMAMLSIIIAIMVHAHSRQQFTQPAQNQIVRMQQNLRAAMSIMTQEIQMAGFDPLGLGTPGIVNMGDGSYGNPLAFTFYDRDIGNDGKDNDRDGLRDQPGELQLIQYALYDAYGDKDMDIGRKSGSGYNQAIAENIQSLQFIYLNADGNPTTDLSGVRAVRLTMTATIDIKERSHAQDTRTLSTIIKFRNLF
jgi:type IV pilus assembly protein PilW